MLVHDSHAWQAGQPLDPPIGVPVPRFDGDRVLIDAVLASTATCAWNKTLHQGAPAVSIVAEGDDLNFGLAPGGGMEGAGWALIAVDIVHAGDDESAVMFAWRSELTEAEAEVQRRLDGFLGDPCSPLAVDLLDRSRTVGVAALGPLRSLVEPLLARR